MSAHVNGSAMQPLTHAEVRDLMSDIEEIGSDRDKTFHDACQRSLRSQMWFSLFMSLRRQHGDELFGRDEVLNRAEHVLEKSKAKSARGLVRAMGLLSWGLNPLEYSSVVSAISELGGRGTLVGPVVEMPITICLSCFVEAGYSV